MVERQLAENTLQAYRYDLADFGEWLPPPRKLSAITTDTLRALYSIRGANPDVVATIPFDASDSDRSCR